MACWVSLSLSLLLSFLLSLSTPFFRVSPHIYRLTLLTSLSPSLLSILLRDYAVNHLYGWLRWASGVGSTQEPQQAEAFVFTDHRRRWLKNDNDTTHSLPSSLNTLLRWIKERIYSFCCLQKEQCRTTISYSQYLRTFLKVKDVFVLQYWNWLSEETNESHWGWRSVKS